MRMRDGVLRESRRSYGVLLRASPGSCAWRRTFEPSPYLSILGKPPKCTKGVYRTGAPNPRLVHIGVVETLPDLGRRRTMISIDWRVARQSSRQAAGTTPDPILAEEPATASAIQPFPFPSKRQSPLAYGINHRNRFRRSAVCTRVAPAMAMGWRVRFCYRRLVVTRVQTADSVCEHAFAEVRQRPLMDAIELRAQLVVCLAADLAGLVGAPGEIHSRAEPGVILGIKPAIRRVVDLDIPCENLG